jgi:hypothetical protein
MNWEFSFIIGIIGIFIGAITNNWMTFVTGGIFIVLSPPGIHFIHNYINLIH